MINKTQKKWLDHLNDSDKVDICAYNPESLLVFEKVKNRIEKVLDDAEVCHRGSSNLKIAGQNEIDIYIPIDWRDYDKYSMKLETIFGVPKSYYDKKRARFVSLEDNIKIEIFLINKRSSDWLNLLKFENLLLSNPILLKEYEKLKLKSENLSTRKYYSLKIEFINKVLSE